jgi:hypothetical protein
MPQLRFRLLHLLILLISLAFYMKVRRVGNIQAFLAKENETMGSGEHQMAEYGQQLKEAKNN